jgi:hypothetical protein
VTLHLFSIVVEDKSWERLGPYSYTAVVGPGGEHERIVEGVIPGYACQIATERGCSDMVKQRSRFAIPDVDVASYRSPWQRELLLRTRGRDMTHPWRRKAPTRRFYLQSNLDPRSLQALWAYTYVAARILPLSHG